MEENNFSHLVDPMTVAQAKEIEYLRNNLNRVKIMYDDLQTKLCNTADTTRILGTAEREILLLNNQIASIEAALEESRTEAKELVMAFPPVVKFYNDQIKENKRTIHCLKDSLKRALCRLKDVCDHEVQYSGEWQELQDIIKQANNALSGTPR